MIIHPFIDDLNIPLSSYIFHKYSVYFLASHIVIHIYRDYEARSFVDLAPVILYYTVTRFVSIFGICTVVDLNGTLLEAKICTKTHIQVSQVRVLASTSVPFRPTTVQMPNLALIETKRVTV